MASPGARRALHAAILAGGLAPALALAVGLAAGSLGADPIETLTHETGAWTLRLLLATLAVTPLRRITGWSALAPLRRTLGLLAFGYATAHLCVYAFLDLGMEWDILLEDVIERPYITVGFTGFLLLVPLAATSTRRAMRRLGRRWVRLHRLVYVAAGCGVLHFLWLVKKDLTEPLVHAGVLAALLAARAPSWRRSRLGSRRDASPAG